MVLAYMMKLVGHPTIGDSILELQRLRVSPGRIKSIQKEGTWTKSGELTPPVNMEILRNLGIVILFIYIYVSPALARE